MAPFSVARPSRPKPVGRIIASLVWLVGMLGLGIFCGSQGSVKADRPHSGEHPGEHVEVVSSRPIAERIDGQQASETVVIVTLKAGQNGSPHRHPGPVFGYVLEGEYELGVDQQPTQIFKQGETFYEPTGCLHRVSRNPSTTGTTRLLAVVLHPRDAASIVLPPGH